MSWIAVGVTLSVASTAYTGMQQRSQQQAQTKQLGMDSRANQSAIQQAEADKQREIQLKEYQQQREARRAESTARAGQANTGIAGITANRQIDNILFQSTLDTNYIKAQGENDINAILNQGFNQSSQIQSAINTSKRNTPSNLEIAVSSSVAGTKTYVGAKSAGK